MKARINYASVAPGALQAMRGLEAYLHDCGLEEHLIHLIKLRASQINGCAYCLDMHWKDLRALGGGFMTQGIVARRSYAASHREVVLRLIRATVEATKYATANEDVTKRAIAKYLGITDAELIRQSYLYLNDRFVHEPFVPEATMQAMVQRMIQVNMIDAKSAQSTPIAAYFDNSYVTELKQSGFLDSVWK